MSKKVIAFDLDGTLAPSKSRLPEPMSGLLSRLLEKYQVCVISGGRIQQFHKQLLDDLKATPEELAKLHLMPTCGTRYYEFDTAGNDWRQVYAEDFNEDEKQQIIAALNKGFDDLGLREKPENIYGETIEDRGSQVTFSALGQDIVDELGEEGVRIKHEWDPDNSKKNKLRDYIAPLIPEFEVRVGGITSIDVTKKGIDKAYGMQKLTELLGVTKEEILFIGDRIIEGGNDYPVKQAGIDTIAIASWQETALVVQAILAVS
jgi:phosphomannomutase